MRVKSVGGSPAAMLPSKLEDVMAVVEEGQVKGSFRGFHSRDTVFESVAETVKQKDIHVENDGELSKP